MNGDNPVFRTVRGYQLANQGKDKLTSALEDYLEMVYRLCAENDYARIVQLSGLLNVKPSSASKMINKLTEAGYLKNDRYEIIQLTEKGRATGEFLLKRHKTVEAFLTLIGSDNPLEETELIEHTLSPATVYDLNIFNEFYKKNPDVEEKFIAYKKSAALKDKKI